MPSSLAFWGNHSSGASLVMIPVKHPCPRKIHKRIFSFLCCAISSEGPRGPLGEKGIPSQACSQDVCQCGLSHGRHRCSGPASTERCGAWAQQRHHVAATETTEPLALLSQLSPWVSEGRTSSRCWDRSRTSCPSTCCSLPCSHISPSLPSWYGAIPVWHALP